MYSEVTDDHVTVQPAVYCIDKERTCGQTPGDALDAPYLLSIMTTATRLYSGLRRKLVLAFDVGTTYSGISYRLISFCFLG